MAEGRRPKLVYVCVERVLDIAVRASVASVPQIIVQPGDWQSRQSKRGSVLCILCCVIRGLGIGVQSLLPLSRGVVMVPVKSGDTLRVLGGHLAKDADAFSEWQVLRADYFVVSLLISAAITSSSLDVNG